MALVYFISSNGENVVNLDCEEDITVTQSNTTTSNSIMSGVNISDGFIEGNKMITVQGLVTYSKSPSQLTNLNLNPIEFINEMENMVKSKQRFTLYADTSYSTLLKDTDDCVIKDWNYTVDKYEDTITVRITFEEQFVTQAATVTFIPPQPSSTSEDSISTKQDNGTTNKKVPGETVGRQVINWVEDR